MQHPRFRPVTRTLMAAGVLLGCLPVQAQQAAAPASDKSPAKIQEVIVTANKVATPASKTPLALSVVDGDALKDAGINDPMSLEQIAPGLEISTDSGRLLVAIRGIVSTAADERGAPSASFNVDGLYIARFEAQGGAFMDLDRIEVLRGPQGTLYGRNSTAGAINLISNKPGKKFEARLGAEVGNYGTVRVEGMVNQPLNDRWSLRAAVQKYERDGYINPGPNTDTPMDSKSDYGARVHLLGQLTRDTSLLLTAETFHQGGGNGTPVPITNFFDGTPAGNDIRNPVYKDIGSEAQRTASQRFAGAAFPAYTNNDHSSLRAELKSTLGVGELTYQLGYQTSDLDGRQNGRFNGNPFYAGGTGTSSALSNELRLNSLGNGPLKWVVGAYHITEDISRSTRFVTKAPPGDVVLRFEGDVKNTAAAVFGQTTYAILPTTRLTAGLRYTHDKKSADYATNGLYSAFFINGGNPLPLSPFSNSKGYTNTSWRLGVDHDLAPNTMVYASASTGFKSGGFNVGTNGTEIKPEYLRAIEAGVKTKLMDDRLQLSAGFFDYSYDNIQVTSVVAVGGGTAAITTNAAKATLRGGELEGKLLVGESGQVSASVALNDAKFGTYAYSSTIDYSGQRMDRAPKTVVGLGYSHRFALPGGSELVASVGTRYNSGYLLSNFSENIRYSQPSYRKSDASLSWTHANGKLNVQVFVKNIENAITLETPVPSQFYVGEPRTYGLRTNYTF